MICKTIKKDDASKEVDKAPQCGDYCDTCGDCLKCYGEDPCSGGSGHSWVVYE